MTSSNQQAHPPEDTPGATGEAALARARLDNARNPAETIEEVQEILCGLVGAERAAIFRVDAAKAVLWLHWSYGLAADQYPFVDLVENPNLAMALSAKSAYFAAAPADPAEPPAKDTVNAIVPIVVNEIAVGVLVIFNLLPHKRGLEDSDKQICLELAIGCERLFQA